MVIESTAASSIESKKSMDIGNPIDPLTLSVYPVSAGSDHVSSYYEDDGRSFSYEQGANDE